MANRGGRPPLDPDALVVTVRHLDTGKAVAWCDGVFSGDKDLAEAARVLYDLPSPMPLGGDMVSTAAGPDGALAAMMLACGERGEHVEGN